MSAGVPEKIVVVHEGQEIPAAFTTNALCEIEAQFGGKSLASIGDDLEGGRGSMSDARALFRAVLIEALPDLTPVGAGRILSDVGADEAARVIQAAFERLKSGLDGGTVKLPEPDARGRLAFEAGGERLVLAVHFNAQAELEAYFGGLSPTEILAKLHDGVAIADIRALFRAALIDHREVTLGDAGRIMDRIGLATASQASAKAFLAAFPKAVPEDEGDQGGNRQQRRAKVAANPTKRRAKAGTGPRLPRSGPAKG